MRRVVPSIFSAPLPVPSQGDPQEQVGNKLLRKERMEPRCLSLLRIWADSPVGLSFLLSCLIYRTSIYFYLLCSPASRMKATFRNWATDPALVEVPPQISLKYRVNSGFLLWCAKLKNVLHTVSLLYTPNIFTLIDLKTTLRIYFLTEAA